MGKAAEQRTGQAQWLSLDEIERLLAWCEPGLIPPILVTLYSGVRTSEYRSVFYCESNNALRIRGFKTHRSDRCVPVHPVLRRVILGMP